MQLWWRKKGGVNIENHEERVSTGIISLAKTDKQQQQNIEIFLCFLFWFRRRDMMVFLSFISFFIIVILLLQSLVFEGFFFIAAAFVVLFYDLSWLEGGFLFFYYQ